MSQKSDHEMITEMYTILCGNGHTGLCKQFEEHKESDRQFRREYYAFKRWILVVLAFLVGTGAVSLSVLKVAPLLAGN